MSWYLDTSAALKLLIEESESRSLVRWMDDSSEPFVSSQLLATELRCAAQRRRDLLPEPVNAVLASLIIVDVTREDFGRAGTSQWGLRAADALHLAVALRVGCEGMVTYDAELVAVVRRVGLEVAHPAYEE